MTGPDHTLVDRLVRLFSELIGAPDVAAALPQFEDGLAQALDPDYRFENARQKFHRKGIYS